MMEIGLRVVRGPDWKWANQDDGEGHVGTVIEIGKAGSSSSPAKTVVVQWDSGSRTNYRVGYQEAFDLRIFDNAPVGVKHPNIICNACRKHGIIGMRWKCTRCRDFDLCTMCYMADKHDQTHSFQRYDNAASSGIDVPQRHGATKIKAKGIFIGAKVVRGPDWDWGNQDGGEGKVGKVIDICGWDNESGRSVSSVTWSSGTTNVYRLGHKGKVDLRYVVDTSSGTYYRDHLPVLGLYEDNHLVPPPLPNRPVQFNVGDQVKVVVDVETLKYLQEGHGGWNSRMVDFIGKLGAVHRVTDRGDIRVQYENCNNRWTFHPSALAKEITFSVGDIVQVIDDITEVRILQKNHGEWIDVMDDTLGKIGSVAKVYKDGDLRVNVNGQTWTFNPQCLRMVPGSATEINNTMTGNKHEEQANNSFMDHLLVNEHRDSSVNDRFVREAAQGHIDALKEMIQKYPQKINQPYMGKTAFQVACHQGHKEIVSLLITASADIEQQDEDGDTALHYSAFGNQPEVMTLLLKKGAFINAVNKAKCSALHVAVNKQHIHCVRVLLKWKCSVNIQDSYGDTALHDAISKENSEIIDLLVNYPETDFLLKNKRGFNVLHHAALKGNIFAIKKLIMRSRQIVDIKKDDGFSALHLAVLNGHYKSAEILLSNGLCDVNTRNNRKQTPLLLAVNQGHCSLTELLFSVGADVNAEDEDGDTGLHLTIMRKPVQTDANLSEAKAIASISEHLSALGHGGKTWLTILCYLTKVGGNLSHRNHRGKTPLDLLGSLSLRDIVCAFSPGASFDIPSSLTESELQLDITREINECIICSDSPAVVLFEPCQHVVTCEECCFRMKKCIQCHEVITKKVSPNGQTIQNKSQQSNVDRLKYLEHKVTEIEEIHCCTICMENRRNVAFLCGHSACAVCAQTLTVCHMCREPITKRINLY